MYIQIRLNDYYCWTVFLVDPKALSWFSRIPLKSFASKESAIEWTSRLCTELGVDVNLIKTGLVLDLSRLSDVK